MMEKELHELRFNSSKLKVTEKLLGENNQHIFQFCLRKLDQDSHNLMD